MLAGTARRAGADQLDSCRPSVAGVIGGEQHKWKPERRPIFIAIDQMLKRMFRDDYGRVIGSTAGQGLPAAEYENDLRRRASP